MMYHFLMDNRAELIARCRAKVALRSPSGVLTEELDHGLTVFLEQLIRTLELEDSADPMRSRSVSGPSGGGAASEIGEAAGLHGRGLKTHGFTVDDVVHHYGDMCQAITDLAADRDQRMSIDEFRTLNRCLDNAIAKAVTEFGYQHEAELAEVQAVALNERLGFLAHELRNQLCTATLALSLIKQGSVGLSGATGATLDRALLAMGSLVDHSLAEVRMKVGMPLQERLYPLSSFIAEIAQSASMEARLKASTLTVSGVDPLLAIKVDRDLLASAVGNLLQNAFKFSPPGSEITLDAYADSDRIFIDVEDHCGGISQEHMHDLFKPFAQAGDDRSGLGLGLSISRRSVEANHGELTLRTIPNSGCVFTISLPKHEIDPSATPGQ